MLFNDGDKIGNSEIGGTCPHRPQCKQHYHIVYTV